MSYLVHHGIKGQKWGVKNGPPYPLGASDHSASERKAGWKSSINKNDAKKNEKKNGLHLTDKQKKLLKIGAAVAVTALVAYGGYRLYKDNVTDYYPGTGLPVDTIFRFKKVAPEVGSDAWRTNMDAMAKRHTADLASKAAELAAQKEKDLSNGILERVSVGRKEYLIRQCDTDVLSNLEIVNSRCSMTAKDWNDLVELPKTVFTPDGIDKAHLKEYGKTFVKMEKEVFKGNLTNCHACTFNGVLRAKGFDVEAPRHNGRMSRLYSALDYFKDTVIETPYDDSKITNYDEFSKVKKQFKKNFGDNKPDSVDILRTLEKKMIAKGEGTFGDLVGGSHSVMYKVENGRVKIYDNQIKVKYDSLQAYNRLAKITDGFISFSRLDNLTPKFEQLLKDNIIVPRS